MFRALVTGLSLAVVACVCQFVQAGSVVVPVDGEVFLKPAGGDAAALTEFGMGTSQADHVLWFAGLPSQPEPDGEISLGFKHGGDALDLYMRTEFIGIEDWAFSSNTVDSASRTVFMDLDNSLGLGGSIMQPLGANVWRLWLDDGFSHRLDDDDNDVVIDLRVVPTVPVPLPPALALVVPSVPLIVLGWRRMSRNRCV